MIHWKFSTGRSYDFLFAVVHIWYTIFPEKLLQQPLYYAIKSKLDLVMCYAKYDSDFD